MNKWIKLFLNDFLFKEAKTFRFGSILKEKELQFAKSFNFPTFKASDGWLDKWKKGKKTTFTVK